MALWSGLVEFNYIKFASYSAVPFVVVLTLNVAVVYRTLRMSGHLGDQSTDKVGHHNSSLWPPAVVYRTLRVSGHLGDQSTDKVGHHNSSLWPPAVVYRTLRVSGHLGDQSTDKVVHQNSSPWPPAVVYRTLRVSPNLRRNFGGGGGESLLTVERSASALAC